jgi:hypothetical protein
MKSSIMWRENEMARAAKMASAWRGVMKYSIQYSRKRNGYSINEKLILAKYLSIETGVWRDVPIVKSVMTCS